MQALAREFRGFLLRGNLVDMAVGIVIGIAFAAVVNALVADLITPIIAALAGKHDFSAQTFTINGSRFVYGDFINAVIAFVSIAAAVFFFVVKPVNALLARRRAEPVDETVRPCPECLSEIPLRRAAARSAPQRSLEARGGASVLPWGAAEARPAKRVLVRRCLRGPCHQCSRAWACSASDEDWWDERPEDRQSLAPEQAEQFARRSDNPSYY